jgi:hypothetical protein
LFQIAVEEAQISLDGIHTFKNPGEIHLRACHHSQQLTALVRSFLSKRIVPPCGFWGFAGIFLFLAVFGEVASP